MNGNKRQVSGHAEALSKRHAYNKRADKAWTCGNTNGSQVRRHQRVATKVRARTGHSLLEKTNDSLGVLARSNLGHDAAKASVEVNLSCDNICADHAMRIHNAHGRLVAGRLQAEDQIPRLAERRKRLFRALTCNNRPLTH